MKTHYWTFAIKTLDLKELIFGRLWPWGGTVPCTAYIREVCPKHFALGSTQEETQALVPCLVCVDCEPFEHTMFWSNSVDNVTYINQVHQPLLMFPASHNWTHVQSLIKLLSTTIKVKMHRFKKLMNELHRVNKHHAQPEPLIQTQPLFGAHKVVHWREFECDRGSRQSPLCCSRCYFLRAAQHAKPAGHAGWAGVLVGPACPSWR